MLYNVLVQLFKHGGKKVITNNKITYDITTFVDNHKDVQHGCECFVKDPGDERGVINIRPEIKYQEFEGFGGAFTDSSGYVYSMMDKDAKEELIHTYFDEDKMNYTIGRIHLDSCDFSVDQYEAMSDANDRSMESFSLERDEKYIIPLMNDVKRLTGKEIELMISPWSPPAFMKTNKERNHGGEVLEEYKEFWAEYICRYIKEIEARGFKIKRMSLQNEPAARQVWDSCFYSAEQERDFLKDYMYPALVRSNLDDIEIFVWDHNKERLYERANTIITEETNHMIAGLAFHWYSGDHFEEVGLVKERFPDKKLVLSEACIEYSKYSADDYLVNAQKYAHDIIGNFNNGMNAFYDWNILLDEKGGPNHVGNYCDAPYLYDTNNHKLCERNTLSYINHFSHYIKPGARRVAFSKYSDDVDVTTFENPDGDIIVVVLNKTKEERPAGVRLNDSIAQLNLPPMSIMTGVIK